jgi:integrase
MPNLNVDVIKALPTPARGNKVHWFGGAVVQGQEVPGGFGVVVTAAGIKSFVLNYRIAGKERRFTIGRCSVWGVPRAVKEARELRQRIDRGQDPLDDRKPAPVPVREKTVADLFHEWLARRNRPSVTQVGAFKRHILPAIGDIPFKELRKSQIATMHDRVRDGAGPVAADQCLTCLSAVLNWQEAREDDWRAPSVRGLKCTSSDERARRRILSEDDIRAIWPAFGEAGIFGVLCKLLLLTGQRRKEIANMTCSEINWEDHTVTIPASRYKTRHQHTFLLSGPAMAILAGIPKRDDGRIFPALNFSRGKDQLDKLAPIAEPWTLHDLRRTAASLMAANGVSTDDVDRVLGHSVGGIAKTYIRGEFMEQKRHAVDILAAAVDRILTPPRATNIVTLARVTD